MSAKARLLTLIVIVSNLAGNTLLSFGIEIAGFRIFSRRSRGVGLLILWTLSRMTLMSWADLSYILPSRRLDTFYRQSRVSSFWQSRFPCCVGVVRCLSLRASYW